MILPKTGACTPVYVLSKLSAFCLTIQSVQSEDHCYLKKPVVIVIVIVFVFVVLLFVIVIVIVFVVLLFVIVIVVLLFVIVIVDSLLIFHFSLFTFIFTSGRQLSLWLSFSLTHFSFFITHSTPLALWRGVGVRLSFKKVAGHLRTLPPY